MLFENDLLTLFQCPAAAVRDGTRAAVAAARLRVRRGRSRAVLKEDMRLREMMRIIHLETGPGGKDQMEIIREMRHAVRRLLIEHAVDDIILLGEAKNLAVRVPGGNAEHTLKVKRIRNIP